MKPSIIVIFFLGFLSVSVFSQTEEIIKNAKIKFNLGKYESAIIEYGKAILIDSTNPNLYEKRGIAKLLIKDYRGAISDYSKAIFLKPNDNLFYSRGLAEEYAEQDSNAIADYTKAIELNPKNANAFESRAFIYRFRPNDKVLAISDYSAAIELKPKNISYYLARASVKLELQDYRGALSDYSIVIKLDSNNSNIYQQCGNVQKIIGDFKGAIKSYSIAISKNPKDADAYYGRGLAKIGLTQKETGCLDLSKAGELGNTEAYNAIRTLCK